jgi:hypothetical protein
MFGWLRRKSKVPSAYVDFYIVISGTHDVEIVGLEGISLKRISRHTYNKHKGLKYWVASRILSRITAEELLRRLSMRAREDVFNCVFSKKLQRFDGIHDWSLE